MNPNSKSKNILLFEVSWEVCNKVGGINTVIKSKVSHLIKHYKGDYFLIGPYLSEKAVKEFQERIPPEELQGIFDKLKTDGIICHYGEWLIPEKPKTILVDYKNYINKKNEIKAQLWESFKIDSLNTEFHDFDEPIIWGDAVGKLLEEISRISREYKNRKNIVAQFHEWLSCGALLYIKRNGIKIGTVFTTHATVLGRTLAGNNVDLYRIISEIDPEKEAYKWKIQSKHQVERVSAHESDVFTTVSEITAIQADHFLGRWPDVLLFNGLDMEKYPCFEEVSIKHRLYREKIKSFLQYYFFPYYPFDLDNTLIYFISGRYEFHNKGIDIFIKALSRLNRRLKEEKSKKTIVAFFWVPRDVIRIKPELVQSRAYYEDIEESIDDNLKDIQGRIIRALISKKSFTETDLFSKEFLFKTKKKVLRFLRKGTPPLCTHDLFNEEDDPILKGFKESNLLNKKGDRVKVVFYPIYLTGADNLLDLDYNESIIGTHLGVFPSYYEPWGYTPLETGALGVASITTDFSGFGRYISSDLGKKDLGIFVIKMFNKSEEEKIENLFEVLYRFSQLDREGRMENKIEARRLASLVDWDKLIGNYIKAHELAVKQD